MAKLLLEEEEVLPTITLEEPVTVSEEEISKPDASIVISDVVMNEISAVYNSISDLNGIILMIASDYSEQTEILDILNEILNERTIHVGMLQTVLSLMSSTKKDLVDTGEEVAQEIANESEANELNK